MKAYRTLIASAMLAALAACGGGGSSNEVATAETSVDCAVQTCGMVPMAAKICVGNGAKKCGVDQPPAPAPVVTTPPIVVAPAPAPDTTTPAPAPAPAPVTQPTTLIPVADLDNKLLQVGDYWLEDGVWGAAALTRGTYTGLTGSQYEQRIGVSPTVGPNGEVSGRVTWKWPTGTTEVKSYPSFIAGNKPGLANSWTGPGGMEILLTDGTSSQVYPSGKTPNTIFPLQLPIQSLYSSFAYNHNIAATGLGHLSYDIWLQSVPDQMHGFNSQKEITHEIMIPLNSWGNYGVHKVGRNPAWYDHDVTIDGRLFHVYAAKGEDGQLRADFFGGWKFVVFQPAVSIPTGTTLDLAKFINYLATRKDSAGTPWSNGREHAVSVELGIEPVEGVGDMNIGNFRVWK